MTGSPTLRRIRFRSHHWTDAVPDVVERARRLLTGEAMAATAFDQQVLLCHYLWHECADLAAHEALTIAGAVPYGAPLRLDAMAVRELVVRGLERLTGAPVEVDPAGYRDAPPDLCPLPLPG